LHILVTGGAGFIGSHLVDALVNKGHQVKVLDNLFRGKTDHIQSHISEGRIEFLKADIREYSLLPEICGNVDLIFHLAAQSNVIGAVEDLDYSFESNVIGTFNMLKAARQSGVERFIFTSSREVYGEARYLPVDENHMLNAKNSYGASKVAGEKYCQVFQNMYPIEVAVVRLANVYGRRDFDRVIPIFLNQALKNEDISIFGGAQLIDFISVEIVVQVLLALAETGKMPDEPVNIGSGKGTNLFDLAQKIIHLTDSKSKIKVEPARSAEVVQFTAEITRFKKYFGIALPDDPLYLLSKMLPEEDSI